MVLQRTSKNFGSCYQCFPEGRTFLDVEEMVRRKLLHLYESLQNVMQGFKAAKGSMDCGVISESKTFGKLFRFGLLYLRRFTWNSS